MSASQAERRGFDSPLPLQSYVITVYVIQSIRTGKRYVGITNNLDRRLAEHRARSSKGGQLLGSFLLLHAESFPDYQIARQREKNLKSGQGRAWLDVRYPRRGPPLAGKAAPV